MELLHVNNDLYLKLLTYVTKIVLYLFRLLFLPSYRRILDSQPQT